MSLIAADCCSKPKAICLSMYGLLPAAAPYMPKTLHLLEAKLTAILVVELMDGMVAGGTG